MQTSIYTDFLNKTCFISLNIFFYQLVYGIVIFTKKALKGLIRTTWKSWLPKKSSLNLQTNYLFQPKYQDLMGKGFFLLFVLEMYCFWPFCHPVPIIIFELNKSYSFKYSVPHNWTWLRRQIWQNKCISKSNWLLFSQQKVSKPLLNALKVIPKP